MLHFTTFFDKNYLSRGLVLIESLQQQISDFEIYVLCLDDFTTRFFENNKTQYRQVITITLDDLEKGDEELLASKVKRSTMEYYFTLSPCVPLFLIEKFNLPHICSLDADIKFYDSPNRIFNYLDNYSIVITPHKFSKENEHKVIHGVYNVSFQIFKNDLIGLNCLKNWKAQCINWCKDELDLNNNRYADQKYLDNWPNKYLKNVKILDDNVCGLAPWNLNNFTISCIGNSFYSESEKIIFFHFHHYRFLNKFWASNGFYFNQVKSRIAIRKIYNDYWNDVIRVEKNVKYKSKTDIRHGKSDFHLMLKLLNEKTLFLKFNKGILIPVNLDYLPIFIKKIIKKIYAKNYST
jgi:hypothetical protein